jgi:hypothetical protein
VLRIPIGVAESLSTLNAIDSVCSNAHSRHTAVEDKTLTVSPRGVTSLTFSSCLRNVQSSFNAQVAPLRPSVSFENQKVSADDCLVA